MCPISVGSIEMSGKVNDHNFVPFLISLKVISALVWMPNLIFKSWPDSNGIGSCWNLQVKIIWCKRSWMNPMNCMNVHMYYNS